MKYLMIVLAVLGVGWAYSTLPEYLAPPEEAGIRGIVADANSDVSKDASAVRKVLVKTDKVARCKNDDGTTDWRCWSQEHNPWADHVAEARLAREEQIAAAKGELLKPKGVWLPGSQKTWMPTRIPIFSCMHITVVGQITRGVYGKAGPEGINFETMGSKERDGFLSLNKDRTTLVPGIPWGAVLGQACTDDGSCGPAIPLRREIYVSPSEIGSGHLSVIANGFVAGQTGAGLLVGIKQVNMSDYNIYEGGFRIDREKADSNMCEQISTQYASR